MKKLLWLWVVAFSVGLSVSVKAQQPAAGTSKAGDSDAGAIAPPAHPATEDQVREYLSLTGAEKAARNVMASSVDAMHTTSVPYLPESFWTDLKAEMMKIDLVSIYVPVYQRYVSEDEMKQSIAFYRTDAGKKMLAVQPLLVRDAQATLRAKGQEIGAAVYQKHKDEIDAAKKKYDAEHAGSGAK